MKEPSNVANRSIFLRRGLALALALVVSSAGCDTRQVEERTTEEHQFDLDEGQRTIDVHLMDGSIQVVSSGGSAAVKITVRSVAHSIDRGAALGLLEAHPVTVEETDAGLRVRGLPSGSRDFVLGGVETSVSLSVPDGLELRLRTDDGLIEIEDLEASVDAESGNGRIRVREVRGRIRLATTDGSIVARDVDGTVEATSEDGSVEVDGRFDGLRVETSDGRIRVACRAGSRVEEPWLVRASDGSIDLELDDGIDLTIEAVASDGDIDNDLARFRGTDHPLRIRGDVGAGGNELFVSTMDGSIRLR